MSPWVLNVTVISIVVLIEMWLSLSLLWRIAQWRSPKARSLIEDYGLQVGTQALEVAAHNGSGDFHLTFGGPHTFLVFGARDCAPCEELLHAASQHPATRAMRLVFVADTDDLEVHPDITRHWEVYRFHDEERSRWQWRAPASPYFHVIDGSGMISAKGIANRLEHLDRLLEIGPTHTRATVGPNLSMKGAE